MNFTTNRASHGGGFMQHKVLILILIPLVNFSTNIVTGSGGGFYIVNTNAKFNGITTFQDNKASGYGGGFTVQVIPILLSIKAVNIISNTADDSGGGFRFTGSNITFNEIVNILGNKNSYSSSQGGGFTHRLRVFSGEKL